MNTGVTYMGLDLHSPLLLTDAVPDAGMLAPLVDAGIGAVVLQPLLEEEIIWDIKLHGREIAPVANYGANLDAVTKTTHPDHVQRFLERIAELKRQLPVPVIAAVDCYSFDAWFSHVRLLEEAGCDAIEFNIQLLPYDTTVSCDDIERLFNDLVSTYRRLSSLPLSVKVSPHFSDLASFMQRLSWMGVQNITLFNTLICNGIDPCQITPVRPGPNTDASAIFWTAVLKKRLTCDLSTVVHDGDGVVRALLSGATTVHINHLSGHTGADAVQAAADTLHNWMRQNGHDTIDSFRGTGIPPAASQGFLTLRAHYLQRMKEARLR
ncbi:MAG: dihydroorotate dehydrogenase (fumarate) [bacterium P3]|nr:MAG: dihydroorotate dehydrogenase (fumarate) [bacterium P3]KWW32479.1 MAG: dihydroorotate dehydrogenase (fumarate) [bacterium F083]